MCRVKALGKEDEKTTPGWGKEKTARHPYKVNPGADGKWGEQTVIAYRRPQVSYGMNGQNTKYYIRDW